MCWSMGVSVAMVGAGAVATGVALHRGDPPAVPAAFAYFTVMEGLQAAGYMYVDQCGSGPNQALTLLSYLHITFQPFFINAFAMAILARAVPPALRIAAWVACFVSAATMLLQIYPFDWAGLCTPGTSLCGTPLCLVSGSWHIGWSVPYNGLFAPIELWRNFNLPFPSYMLSVFVVPLLYGAWRFVVFHALAGPILASLLTDNPLEMPAIWCLFSIALLSVGLLPPLRRVVGGGGARLAPA